MKIPLKQYWSLLGTYLKPEWPRAVFMFGLLLGSIGLQLFVPQIVRAFIDAALAGAPVDALTRLGALFLVLALGKEVGTLWSTYISQDVRWRSTNALRRDMAMHALRLDMKFHNLKTPGEMIERVDSDVDELSNFFSQFVIQILGNVVLLVGVLFMLFREDPRIGLAFLVFCLITFVVLVRIINYAVGQWERAREASAELFGFLEERLAGTEDIAALGAGPYKLQRFSGALTRHLVDSRSAWVKGAVVWMVSLAIFTLGNILAFAMGAVFFGAGTLTIGGVYVIFHYTELLRRPLETITRQMQDLQRAGGSVVRIRELFAIQPDQRDGPGIPGGPTALAEAGALDVVFDHVEFSYDDDGRTLHGIDFRVHPGEVLGLLGRTGSGKTTIARLLFRLYDPQSGAIRMNGIDIREPALETLRRGVAMVTQDVQLFKATVRDNLTFFDRTIPDEAVKAALQDLGLWDWVVSLPKGLDTLLESGGGGLSAGEAQLLAFTRVFLRDPGLVVLDEASSRLDPATEQLIERAIGRLFEDRTAIIIAHRLATVQRADRIMILEDGRIAEHGDRHALAADPDSRFAGLLRTGMEEVLV
ncbi:MAG TPA: ABC transporter ATP-binding protein [Anaerolineales bacterium]|nr:ABC transporter ATP-binding protein [Anaerolineales bacterium]